MTRELVVIADYFYERLYEETFKVRLCMLDSHITCMIDFCTHYHINYLLTYLFVWQNTSTNGRETNRLIQEYCETFSKSCRQWIASGLVLWRAQIGLLITSA